MSSRVPTSASGGPSAAPAPRPNATKTSVVTADKNKLAKATPIPLASPPTKPKAISTEAQLWSGVDIDRSLEMSMKDVEQRLAEEEVTNSGAADEARQVGDDVRQANERDEGKHPLGNEKWANLWKTPSGEVPKAQPKQQQQQAPVKEQAGQTAAKATTSSNPAYTPSARATASATAASQANLKGVVSKNMLSGSSAHSAKPPDAFALLKQAKEEGVLFVEDEPNEQGSVEHHEDPELAAAVEECIRQCFGLKGILRIVSGKNDLQEPIVVVVTMHGLTEASLAKIPEKVHRFATITAIPFELLPLKRER